MNNFYFFSCCAKKHSESFGSYTKLKDIFFDEFYYYFYQIVND